MALPETVAVRYTEEDAEYVSVRPVVRQTFRLHELVDMVLAVTGKELARVRHVLRSGTVVFHFYRYLWQGFEADVEELSAVLARFPDPDPARQFRAEECAAVFLESNEQPARHVLELSMGATSRRRLFRSRSLWDSLLDLARAQPPAYRDYSYARHADVYELPLTPERLDALAHAAKRVAPRALRAQLARLVVFSRAIFLCPRAHKHPSNLGAMRP